ncbi:type IV secretory system conjugative DNA transfer family protein [Enterocloster bolteae]|uniref:type IV secretory system conjugative DNA transfer family protein n=1 Tax=Enterocloster bolteae TaxID=208479 RepID=UPI00210ABF82|nr:type IV secretory system conjugative DNA transfer family protein [Enterocloster bolteae]MCQ5144464.1 type IV secretory system conjugative DNA transfer family protein [Enterocloster bolteae]
MQTQQIVLLICVGLGMFAVIGGLSLLAHYYTLNGIKSKTVGDGQHGTARFATGKEIKETYVQVPYEPERWRRGEALPKEQGLVVGYKKHGTSITALIDSGDIHCLMIGAAGVGKTANFLYPNIEYACASGMSWLCTDTKGDLFRNYAGIAKDCYGYNISVLDLRNPTRSDGDNILTLVNKYMDEYLANPKNLAAKAKAEKYAKITAKTIICSDGAEASSYGQNAFFYDAAEGLLASVILLIAEFCEPEKRHIISVFKLIQDLLAPSPVKNRSLFQLLMDKLPPTHKAKWFAGAALNSADQAMASVLSTAMSRLNAFLDSEMEQILCFDSALDTETFCTSKSAIFIVLPEEDNTKYFMVSLFLQQLYREMLTIADEHGGKLPNRVMVFADEIGTIPKIESMEMMFSAGRSRRISMVPIIQSFAQLQKNYGKEGSSIIIDNCQDILFGGFAPNSESADILSKALGNRTVLSGSISRGKNDPSQSLQMMSRPLMSPDELKTLPKGHFILAKTGCCPMQTSLPLFLKWSIRFGEAYEVAEQATRPVVYADRFELEQEILRRRDDCDGDENMEEPPLPPVSTSKSTGQLHTLVSDQKEHRGSPHRPPLRTD